ncbi:protein-L-isoaspartate O-methyltransferase [Citreicella sp. C3M06]|uniref:protein-L-isoaspartate O-methyltransferase family protein n=1 Tax=Roseobacteraceae TaxID=2854170 RepID=UPI001C09C9E4|nr:MULTISPECIES: rRNA adenine N-6-methyltransferase family protein [Roseobacteraceae]MBU2959591.1 protein-L-isoaspartate O-methyltransferase [Citreicella sp. C3M06]MDO6586244.1 rRNA adenine N-6-methyltransferase family protein [Salipiger sp. 1_MG-2023]
MTDFATRRRVMVDTQVRPSDVTKFPIIDAMLRIPREAFVPASEAEAAYAGRNLHLSKDRVVLEARTLAKMLDALNLDDDDLVLDIGTGFGYSSAVIARIAEAVVAVEDDESFAAEAQALLGEHADNVLLHTGPLAEGAAAHGPYDAIIVQGGVAVLPDTLLAQLKDGGRIACIFMDGALGTVRIGWKIDGAISWRFAFNAAAPVLKGFEKKAEFAL